MLESGTGNGAKRVFFWKLKVISCSACSLTEQYLLKDQESYEYVHHVTYSLGHLSGQ